MVCSCFLFFFGRQVLLNWGGKGGGHSSQSTFLLQKQILPVNITATYGLVANIKSSIFALTSSISSSNLRVSSSESHSSTSVPTETRSSEENNVTYQWRKKKKNKNEEKKRKRGSETFLGGTSEKNGTKGGATHLAYLWTGQRQNYLRLILFPTYWS